MIEAALSFVEGSHEAAGAPVLYLVNMVDNHASFCPSFPKRSFATICRQIG